MIDKMIQINYLVIWRSTQIKKRRTLLKRIMITIMMKKTSNLLCNIKQQNKNINSRIKFKIKRIYHMDKLTRIFPQTNTRISKPKIELTKENLYYKTENDKYNFKILLAL